MRVGCPITSHFYQFFPLQIELFTFLEVMCLSGRAFLHLDCLAVIAAIVSRMGVEDSNGKASLMNKDLIYRSV